MEYTATKEVGVFIKKKIYNMLEWVGDVIKSVKVIMQSGLGVKETFAFMFNI
jgi:hypothetical protein